MFKFAPIQPRFHCLERPVFEVKYIQTPRMRHYLKLLLVVLGLTGNGQTQTINSTLPQIRQIGEDDPCAAELGVPSLSDNLSCEFAPQGFARCYNRSELCNGDRFCFTGSDEGENIPALDCKFTLD